MNSTLITWMHIGDNVEFLLVPGAAVAGFIGDILLHQYTAERPAWLRLFAFMVPVVYGLGALAVIHFLGTTVWGRGGLRWEIHMWLGVPILAGAVGLGLSLLVVPPAIPVEVDS